MGRRRSEPSSSFTTSVPQEVQLWELPRPPHWHFQRAGKKGRGGEENCLSAEGGELQAGI